MASGTLLFSKVRGWREGRPEEAGTSGLTCKIPTSLSHCVMTQPCHRELLWRSTCTKGDLRLTCTLSASIFIRSDTNRRGILFLCAVLVFDYFQMFCLHSIKSSRQLLLHTISLTVATHSMIWKVYCTDNSAFLCVQIQSKSTVLGDQDLVASCVPHCYTQDVSLALQLPPGSYSVVPSTYQPDCSADFSLSVACRVDRSATFLCLDWYCTTVGLIIELAVSGKWWNARRGWGKPSRRSVYGSVGYLLIL